MAVKSPLKSLGQLRRVVGRLQIARISRRARLAGLIESPQAREAESKAEPSAWRPPMRAGGLAR